MPFTFADINPKRLPVKSAIVPSKNCAAPPESILGFCPYKLSFWSVHDSLHGLIFTWQQLNWKVILTIIYFIMIQQTDLVFPPLQLLNKLSMFHLFFFPLLFCWHVKNKWHLFCKIHSSLSWVHTAVTNRKCYNLRKYKPPQNCKDALRSYAPLEGQWKSALNGPVPVDVCSLICHMSGANCGQEGCGQPAPK